MKSFIREFTEQCRKEAALKKGFIAVHDSDEGPPVRKSSKIGNSLKRYHFKKKNKESCDPEGKFSDFKPLVSDDIGSSQISESAVKVKRDQLGTFRDFFFDNIGSLSSVSKKLINPSSSLGLYPPLGVIKLSSSTNPPEILYVTSVSTVDNMKVQYEIQMSVPLQHKISEVEIDPSVVDYLKKIIEKMKVVVTKLRSQGFVASVIIDGFTPYITASRPLIDVDFSASFA